MASQRDVINTILAEAGNNPAGMAAVAHVIANRASQWNLSPGAVVAQPNQFEGYSNPSPGGVANMNNASLRQQAEAIWDSVQNGQSPDPTNGGVNYYGSYIAPPSWARNAVANGQSTNIGGNVFLLGSGTVPPASVPAANSYATATAPPPVASPSQQAADAVTNPDGSVNWGAFYQGLTVPTPLASNPSSSPLYGDFSALAMAQPPQSGGSGLTLADQLALNPSYAATPVLGSNNAGYPQMSALYPSGATADSGAVVLGDRNASGSPDDRDASNSLLARMLATVQSTGAGPTTRQVQTVPVDPNTGQPVLGADPGYNSTTEAQHNALLALGGSGGSIDGSALPNNGFFSTGQGIAGTAQLPAGYHPGAGLVPSLDSVPTPSSNGGGDSGQNAQSWSNLISSFDDGSDNNPYAIGTVNNAKDQSQLPQGTGLNFAPSTTQQISVKQLNPAYTAWLNDQNSAIYGVQGVDSPSLDANGNVVLPSSYLGAAAPAPVKYLTVPKTVTVPGKAISAPNLLGIAAAAPAQTQPIAVSNGYLYQPNGNGGYTNVGQQNTNLSPSQVYAAAAAPALASQTNLGGGGGNHDSQNHAGGSLVG